VSTPARTLSCTSCGREFEHPVQGGRPPARCPDCRDPISVERSKLSYGLRKKRENELARQAAAAEEASRLVRFAAALRVFPADPETAAKFAGLRVPKAKLPALVAEARKAFASIAHGDMREAGRLADGVLTMIVSEIAARRAELPAKDLIQAGRLALFARQEFVADGPAHSYTAINLSVVPPPAEGKLTPDQRAKVHGVDPDAE